MLNLPSPQTILRRDEWAITIDFRYTHLCPVNRIYIDFGDHIQEPYHIVLRSKIPIPITFLIKRLPRSLHSRRDIIIIIAPTPTDVGQIAT